MNPYRMIMKISKGTTRILGLMLLASATANAQTVRKNMAQKYFGYLDFSKAAPIYEELAQKTVKQGTKEKPVDWEMVRKAAQSAYYMRNYQKAAHWYGVMAEGKAATKEDLLAYFEALRYTGNYNKASVYLDSLAKLDPNDYKTKEYLRQANYFDYLKRDSAVYKVEKMPFNKDLGDFGPAFYDKGLVYASSRKKGSLNGKYGWDNTAFLNIYYVEADGDKYPKNSKLQNRSFRSSPHDGPVFYSKDGKTAFVTRNRTEKDIKKGDPVPLNLYVIQKGGNGKWGKPQPFPYNSRAYSVGHAALSPDEKTLFFTSDMPGGVGGTDIWMSQKQGAGWAKPVNVGKAVNTPDDEMFPFVSADGNLYFASKGHVGLGGLDIFESRFGGSVFGAPVNMGYPVNTQYDDFAFILKPDGKNGFFSSDRADYVDRIYGLKMEKRVTFNLEGNTFTQAQKKILPNTQIVALNTTLGDSVVTTTDDSGYFHLPLLAESDYVISAAKKDYTPVAPVRLSTKGLTESKTLTAELLLKPAPVKQNPNNPAGPANPANPTDPTEPYVNEPVVTDTSIARPQKPGEGLLVVRVVDCTTGEKIANLPLILKDMETGVESRVKTDANGELIIPQPLRDLPLAREFAVINEALAMDAAGHAYLPTVKKVYFIVRGNEPKHTVTKEICLSQLKEGDAFELKDIYYDFDKATLRPLSITQLDKAYDYLMRNPGVKLELSSHTDSRANNDYNIDLSQRRAKSCVDYLTKVKGLPANRIVAKGYGETRLTNNCADGVNCSEEEHQLNRRTEIRILKSN